MALMWEKFVRYLRASPQLSMIGDEEFMLRFQEEHNKRNNIAPGKESIFSKFINKGENKKWQTK